MLFIMAAVIGIGLSLIAQKRKGKEISKKEIGMAVGGIIGVIIASFIGYLL